MNQLLYGEVDFFRECMLSKGFIKYEVIQMVYFPVVGEGLRFFDSLKCMNTIFRGFQMTATVLSHQRMHKWFTFSVHGDKRSAARDGDNSVSGISNNYNGFTTSEIALCVHFPRARGKYRRSRG